MVFFLHNSLIIFTMPKLENNRFIYFKLDDTDDMMENVDDEFVSGIKWLTQ